MRARHVLPCLIILTASLLQLTPVTAAPHAPTSPAALAARPRWMQRIDTVVGDLPVSVVIGYQGRDLYRHLHWVARAPASNEKLLLSMALLDRFPSTMTIATRVLGTRRPSAGVLHGDLWIVGHGDPEVDRPDMTELAAALKARGITRITGRVFGSTGPFVRDWSAPGWKDYFPRDYVAIPTGLTFHGNVDRLGRHIADPERRAALSLTARLKAAGIRVRGKPGMGTLPPHMFELASVRSLPLRALIHRMDLWSRNLYAEILGKYLAARVSGKPGSIARAGRAIGAYVHAHGAPDVVAHDGSGLSYANRATAQDIVNLLQDAEGEPWGDTLRDVLAHGDQGTLRGRLGNVEVRAKTGTLTDISALSGWVWLNREQAWAEFSILSSGISKSRSVSIENAIVQVVNANAAPPAA
jgi:D-alanyl-D-alanine carboxypeptidase/D-alanyl-D-alanine-endopeptidase (penicillin-binding protein 4)